jgi:uncharacterized protein
VKFHLTAASDHVFTGYGEGYVAVNNTQYRHPVVVATGREVVPWEAASFETLTAEHLRGLVDLGCDIILVGTGATHRFPAPEVLRPLAAAGVGIEVMDTRAACRTYNILTAEGRQVVAAVLVD